MSDLSKSSDQQQQQQQAGASRKLHIDPSLIKSASSTLPDELRELGVCAYDESEFQRGVLYQVDVQIAEYELEKAETAAARNHNHQHHTTSDKSKKRRSNELDDDEEEDEQVSRARQEYEMKKARLDAHLDMEVTSRSLLEEDDESSSSNSGIGSAAPVVACDESTERMIKMGEMTPFGSK